MGNEVVATEASKSELIERLGMYMKLRHVDEYTFDICINYKKNQSAKNTRRLYMTLQRWAKKRPKYKGAKPLDDYGYTADTFEKLLSHIGYCSDRMNQGRAKALLRLLNQHENT